MGHIFISFRREDTHDMAWRLNNYIQREGLEIMYDMDMFGAGDFRVFIRRAIESASVVMVLVGQKWLDEAAPDGIRSPGEWVQAEIELAFAKGIPVLPILVHGSSMPRAEYLPESIRNFVFQQAVSVRSDASFDSDADIVIKMLNQLAPKNKFFNWKKWIGLRGH